MLRHIDTKQTTRRTDVFATAITTVMACSVVIRCMRVLSQLQWKRKIRRLQKFYFGEKDIIVNLTFGKA